MSKTYIDARGWRYKVMPGLGVNQYKGRYNKPDKRGWHCIAKLPWRETSAEAELDLRAMAVRKGWLEVVQDE